MGMTGSIGRTVRRVAVTAVGGLVLLVGIALLVLPGPGGLIVLLGLIILATEIPAVHRFVEPVRQRAMQAAEDSVSSPVRLAASLALGLFLLGAGVLWGLNPQLPFEFPIIGGRELPLPGWGTGAGLIVSGIIVLGLLGYSYRQVQQRRRTGPAER